MKKESIKELDFSKGKPNKYYGRPMRIIGDRRFTRQPNPSDKLFHFTNTRNGRVIEVWAPNKKEARLIFLKDFNLERMPAGFEIEEVQAAA
jgi:hypothetical protein